MTILYEEVKTRARVDTELSEEFEIKVVADVVTEFAGEDALSELLYSDYLFLMSETIKGHRNKFLSAFESQGFKVNHGKTKSEAAS